MINKKHISALSLVFIGLLSTNAILSGPYQSKPTNMTIHFKGKQGNQDNLGNNFFASELDNNTKGFFKKILQKTKINCLNNIEKIDFSQQTPQDIFQSGVKEGWKLKGEDFKNVENQNYKKGYIDGTVDSKKIVETCYNKFLRTNPDQGLTEKNCLELIKTCIYENMIENLKTQNKNGE